MLAHARKAALAGTIAVFGATSPTAVVGFAIGWACARAWSEHKAKASADLRRRSISALVSGLMGLACALAGERRAHFREAWAADQYDPETKELLPAAQRLRLAAGDVMAAICCRLGDATDRAWRPVDALLSSWRGSRLAMTIPVTVAAGLVFVHEGFYGLITNAENLGVILAAPYAAIKGLRKYRQIETPSRPAADRGGSGQ